MPYYAVQNGRNPGVYHSWEDCSEQVNQYSNARYKKFYSSQEAWDFVSEAESSSAGTSYGYEGSYYEPSSSSSSEEEYYTPPVKYRKSAVVYTDGCCASNGRSGAHAGIGVYWGKNHPLNVAERLPGRQTNQRAEIQAACKAVAQAKSQNINKLDICTDSKFTINGITKWVPTWKNNDWTLSTGGTVKNKQDFEKLDKLSRGMDITWKHVPAHAGYVGNEAADELARIGSTKSKKKC
ncbi:ribonuclease H1-like [Ambystoma mexicanum]|uniref:ribonuclease H1-like n=1 Tax=Ambystoma mexicanum TaxID=8296 RepID=UPI0037E87F29